MSDRIDYTIREARAEDAPVIRRLIRAARLDPTSLKWQNFLVAENSDEIIAIGQIKPYPGCEELGSLVTLRPYRGQGIASALMRELEARAGDMLYLLCAAKMESFYLKHGYRTIGWWQAPAFLKLKTLPVQPLRLLGLRVLIMRKDRTEN